MKRRDFLGASAVLPASALLAACGHSTSDSSAPASDSPKVVLPWARANLAAIRAVQPGPPMAARYLAIVHTAMYDAWAAYDAKALGTRFGAAPRRTNSERTAANRARAVSFAAYTAATDQFPSQKSAFDAVLTSLGYSAADAVAPRPDDPAAIGIAAAGAVLSFRDGDGSNQRGTLTPSGTPFADYTGYVALNPPAVTSQPTQVSGIPAPDHWQPLSYLESNGTTRTPAYLAPFWGRVTPFALTSASQFRPPPPKALGSAGYIEQAMQVLDLEVQLGDREKTIAEYWADGPSSELPPGHWCLHADFVSLRDGQGDDQSVRMFFALTNALLDASIATWEAKRFYDYVRPITAIRYLMGGKMVTGFGPLGPAGGLATIDGAAWIPFQPTSFVTPPFPEYTSGHSAFSAAAAEVLRRFTGSDTFGASYTQPASSLRIQPTSPLAPVTLSWTTFSDAANEAGMSRLYGGIHFVDGNREGLTLGRKVGALAFEKARTLWEGG